MSIEKSAGYKTSDGTWHGTIEDAQKHELDCLLITVSMDVPCKTCKKNMIDKLIEDRERVISILRFTGRKPRQPKPKVGRPRKPKARSNNEPDGPSAALKTKVLQ